VTHFPSFKGKDTWLPPSKRLPNSSLTCVFVVAEYKLAKCLLLIGPRVSLSCG